MNLRTDTPHVIARPNRPEPEGRIRRPFVAAALALLLMLTAFGHAGASGKGVSDRWGCADIATYRVAFIEAMPRDSSAIFTVLEADDFMTVRPSVLRDASDEMDEWAGNLEDFRPREIPRAVEEYHDGMVDSISLMSIMFFALSQGNTLGLLAYTDSMEQATLDVERGERLAERRCPVEWNATPSESPLRNENEERL